MVRRKKSQLANNKKRQKTARKGNISISKTLKTKKSKGNQKIPPNQRQSPIDIHSEIIHHDPKKCQKSSLRLNYSPGDCSEVSTNSSGFRVDVSPKCSSYFRGHHLPGRYQLAQFHAHWGEEASCGSEHRINGRPWSGEVHFVFWNKKYKTVERAMEQGDGLAVLAVFLKEGAESSNYQLLLDLVQQAHGTQKSIPMPEIFDLEQLLPLAESRDFITYLGSLTTAPYSECVIWTVLLEPMEVSKKQMNVLRAITPANYRECQDLCHRKVFSSTNVISK